MAARDRRLRKSRTMVRNRGGDKVGAGNTEILVSLSKFICYRVISSNLNLRFAHAF